jgi:hypothetical protein
MIFITLVKGLLVRDQRDDAAGGSSQSLTRPNAAEERLSLRVGCGECEMAGRSRVARKGKGVGVNVLQASSKKKAASARGHG